jgi:hypothetical protein
LLGSKVVGAGRAGSQQEGGQSGAEGKRPQSPAPRPAADLSVHARDVIASLGSLATDSTEP